jgi:RNA polymerase sporulation-specific sigma factor
MNFSNIISRFLNKIGLIKPVFYINGPEILPEPLTLKEEQELLNENSESARDKLIVHNLRLVVYVAKRFENTGVGIEELISIGTVGLMKAVFTFNTDKNIRLATYASRCIENEILMFIRKTSSQKHLCLSYCLQYSNVN